MDDSITKSDKKRSKRKYYLTNTKNRMIEYSHEGKIYYFEPGVNVEVPFTLYELNLKLKKSEVIING